jgi:hypothetical protein
VRCREWVALAGSLMVLAGCDRTPRFVPASADSTGAVPADSTSIYVQMARERWESPQSGEEAADLTARIVIQELRNRPGEGLAARARDAIDSLHLGAEVAGRGSFAVVNLFPRSDPGGGSWPYIFWRDGTSVRYQALEGGGMRLAGTAIEASDPAEAARIAVLYTRVGAAGPQPFVFVWQRPPQGAAWRLQQSLGPDSLGSVGAARFVEPAQDGAVLVSRTYRPARGFDECAACPHVYRTRRFAWDAAGLVSVSDEVERTPYFSFVQLIQALMAGDRQEAERWVADPSLLDAAEGYEWGSRSKGSWRLAPGSAANARELLFFRGNREAYRVHFDDRRDDWVLTSFEPTSRTIE